MWDLLAREEKLENLEKMEIQAPADDQVSLDPAV